MKFGMTRGAVFVFLMFYAGLACSVVTFPTLMFVLIPSRAVALWRRRYTTFILGHFSRFAGLLIRTLYGTRVFIYSDSKEIMNEEDNKVLICSNHRTRIDWMFIIWIYGSVIRKVADMVVILKNDLKQLPIIGWCMQMTQYVFLQRKREQDIPHIQRMLRYLMTLTDSTESPVSQRSLLSLLIFPEGTDLSDGNVVKSNAYAKDENLPERKYVLHPKSAGLITAIECFRERDVSASAAQSGSSGEGSVLHDLTLAYEDEIFGQRPSEMSLFSGDFPRAVHVHVQRHAMKDLPHSQKELSQWVHASFTKKEMLLEEFYSSIAPNNDTGGGTDSTSGAAAVPAGAIPCQLSSWPQLLSHPLSESQSSFSQSTFTFLLMCSLMGGLTLGYYVEGTGGEMFRSYLFMVIVGHTVLTHFGGGIDNIELNVHACGGTKGGFFSSSDAGSRDKTE